MLRSHRPPLLRRFGYALRKVYTGPEKWLYARGLRSAGGLALPDFLGIGVPFSGTAWLHANLIRHPEVFIPKKEMRFFTKKFYRIRLVDYARRFEPGRGKKKGEITPLYMLLSRERIAFIRKVMPAVRLIFLMRNPADRAWAWARRVFLRERRFEEVGERELLDFWAIPEVAAAMDYRGILENWLAVFPREQLHVALYDDLKRAPEALLAGVMRHIGIEPPADWTGYPLRERFNANPPQPLPPVLRDHLRERFRPQIEAAGAFGAPVEAWLAG
jgi:hypothetical protein